MIASCPPQSVSAPHDVRRGTHDAGGMLGLEVIDRILSGAWDHLTDRGILVSAFSSPLTTELAIENVVRRAFAGKPVQVIIKPLLYDYSLHRHRFYRQHGVRLIVRGLLVIRKASTFSLTRVAGDPSMRLSSRARVGLIRAVVCMFSPRTDLPPSPRKAIPLVIMWTRGSIVFRSLPGVRGGGERRSRSYLCRRRALAVN
jgi:hypothetical protein